MIRVYQFHLGAPIANAELVREQMVLSHRYRNTLTEIERARRAAMRDLALSAGGDIPALTALAEAAKEAEEAAARAVKTQRSKTRSRSETEEARQVLRTARAKRSEAVRLVREARQRLRTDPQAILDADAVNERAKALLRGARALSGVFWGSYLLVEDAMQAAAKAPLYDGLEPNDPRFLRSRGEGQLGVQIQKGMPSEQIFGEGTSLRVDPMNELAWHSEVRGERRRLCKTKLHMRVGSTEARGPVWATWPMVMHRKIPPGKIKEATVTLRMVGPRQEWSVEITVDLDQAPLAGTGGTGVVAIDIGWRVIGDEVRAACWRGADGQHGELRLSASLLGSFRKADDLRRIRSMNFNVARDTLALTLKTLGAPPWLTEMTQHLGLWQAPNRLAAVALRWRKNRFALDDQAFLALETWRFHDHHLWTWETAQRTSTLRHRREVYRVFGSELARKYGTVVFEDFDLRTMAKRPQVEDPAENETARANRVTSALSELRTDVMIAFSSRGGTSVKVPAHDTTRECHLCHHTEAFDAASELVHVCGGCGVPWDQDENAAWNLLERHARGPATPPEPAKELPADAEKETRWAKAKRMKGERLERAAPAPSTTKNAAE